MTLSPPTHPTPSTLSFKGLDATLYEVLNKPNSKNFIWNFTSQLQNSMPLISGKHIVDTRVGVLNYN